MWEYLHLLIYIYRENFLIKRGGGLHRFFFVLEKRMQMMHSDSIPSRLVLIFS